MSSASTPTAIVCLTGSELTRGELQDRNGTYLSSRLTSLGFHVAELRILPDRFEQLVANFAECAERADFVVVSGGLGPTADDRTVEALSRVFDRRIVRHAEAQERMKKIALANRIPEAEIPTNFYKQAEILEGSDVLLNPAGLAPGFVIATRRGSLATLPGVPRELTAMYEQVLEPILLANYDLIGEQVLRAKIIGVAESIAEDKIQSLEFNRDLVEYGIRARPGDLTIKFVVRVQRAPLLDAIRDGLVRLFGERLTLLPAGFEDHSLHHLAHAELLERKLTIATAESCTGGLIAKQFTDLPGSSAYFTGAVVAYQNAAKTALLGVPVELLRVHGAVSPEVAKAMAEGARERFQSDYAISTTGIAGPGGGSTAKPVGLVYLAIARPRGDTRVDESRFHGDREFIRLRTASRALDLLLRDLRA